MRSALGVAVAIPLVAGACGTTERIVDETPKVNGGSFLPSTFGSPITLARVRQAFQLEGIDLVQRPAPPVARVAVLVWTRGTDLVSVMVAAHAAGAGARITGPVTHRPSLQLELPRTVERANLTVSFTPGIRIRARGALTALGGG